MRTGSEQLFSYGTLQAEAVQLATFGRKLLGEPDALIGYRQARIEIQAAAAEADYYQNAQFTGDESDCVEGTRFLVSREELEQADVYERTADYGRISVRLRSGHSAWVYVSAASAK